MARAESYESMKALLAATLTSSIALRNGDRDALSWWRHAPLHPATLTPCWGATWPPPPCRRRPACARSAPNAPAIQRPHALADRGTVMTMVVMTMVASWLADAGL